MKLFEFLRNETENMSMTRIRLVFPSNSKIMRERLEVAWRGAVAIERLEVGEGEGGGEIG